MEFVTEPVAKTQQKYYSPVEEMENIKFSQIYEKAENVLFSPWIFND